MIHRLPQDADGAFAPAAAWTFAQEWAAAWNARDIERVLAHFHEDATFDSPIALRLGHGDGGRLAGKEAIRAYWTAAIALNPDLHFEVTGLHLGISTIVIDYRTQDGTMRAEVLSFRDGRVAEGHGTFPAETLAPASR